MGRVSTEPAIVKAKWCSVSAVAETLLSSFLFDSKEMALFWLGSWHGPDVLFVIPFHLFAGFNCKLLPWSIWVLFHCGDNLFSGFQLLVSPCVLDSLHSARKRQVETAAVISKVYLET